MVTLSFIDIAIVTTYMTTCLAVGFYKSSKIKNIKEYAVGDRNFSTLVLVSTLFATFVSAVRIGEVSNVYSYGLIFAIPFFLMPINWTIVKCIYARNIWRFEGCISMSEIMERLYGQIGKYTTNIAAMFTGIGILTIQAVAIGLLLQYFFFISYFSGVLIGMTIITIYSSLGGIRAVALTDVFQFLIFFIALPVACGYSFYQIGSFENIVNALPNSHLTLLDNNGSTLTICGFIFWMLMPVLSGPYIQRLLMSKNQKQLNNSYNIIIVLCLFLVSIMILIAFTIRALYPDIDAKFAFYHYIANLPPVLVGFLVAGMLAIIMSSADSWLNTLSVVIVNDIFKKQLLSLADKQKLLVAKVTTCLCSTLAITIANMSEQEIVKLDLLSFVLSLPLYFIPMTTGFLGFKSNKNSFIISVTFGFIGIFIAKYQFGEFGTMAVLYSMIGSIIGFFGAHYWQFPHELKKLQKRLVGKLKNITENVMSAPGKVVYKLTHFSIVSQNNNYNYYFGVTFFFVLLNVPIFMFGLTGADNNLMFIRIIASVLCILMCLSEMWLTNKAREIFAYMVITFCLPFLGVYSYLVSGYELIWLVNMVVSIILFFVLIPQGYSLLFGIIGGILSYGLFAYYGKLSVHNHHIPAGQYSAFMLSILLLCTLYYINLQSKREKKSLQTLGHSIAHDVGAPLSLGIVSTEMTETALKNKDYAKVEEYLALQKESQNKAMHDLKVMLSAMSTNTKEKSSDWGKYLISESIHAALRHHYMLEKEKKRVTFIASEDFTYTGSLTMLRHLISNLLVNVFKYAGHYAEIEIRIHKAKRSLHFKDDGCGMPAAIKDDVFKKYATTNGNGIGLRFCKEAMHLMQGDIECISEDGKGTEFIMIFPKSIN